MKFQAATTLTALTISLASPAFADRDNCMDVECSGIEERAHDRLADHFADQIDGFLSDNDTACESPQSFISELSNWGIRATLTAGQILIEVEGETLNDILGGRLYDDIAGQTLSVAHDKFVEEMNDRGEC